jgi:hypothetical protein
MRAVKDSLATPWRELVQRPVRRLCWMRAVGDQTGRPPGEKTCKLGRGGARQLVWSLCSQSPHDEAVVARCAQWRLHQPPRWILVKSREISQSMRAVKHSLAAPPRSLSDIAFVTRRRRCCRMQGRRHEKTGRTTTSGEWWFKCQRL